MSDLSKTQLNDILSNPFLSDAQKEEARSLLAQLEQQISQPAKSTETSLKVSEPAPILTDKTTTEFWLQAAERARKIVRFPLAGVDTLAAAKMLADWHEMLGDKEALIKFYEQQGDAASVEQLKQKGYGR